MLNQKIKIDQNDAIIIIDVQNDFCPNGALAVPNGDQIIDPINKAIPLFKHIILSQDWHPRDHKSFASNHKDKNPFQTCAVNGFPNLTSFLTTCFRRCLKNKVMVLKTHRYSKKTSAVQDNCHMQ